MTEERLGNVIYLKGDAYRVHPIDGLNYLGDRRCWLLRLVQERLAIPGNTDENARRAGKCLERVVIHFLQSHPHQQAQPHDIHRFLDRAQIDLDEAEKLLNLTCEGLT